jgi:hypothetical protein
MRNSRPKNNAVRAGRIGTQMPRECKLFLFLLSMESRPAKTQARAGQNPARFLESGAYIQKRCECWANGIPSCVIRFLFAMSL